MAFNVELGMVGSALFIIWQVDTLSLAPFRLLQANQLGDIPADLQLP
jgi:hypothetical protein